MKYNLKINFYDLLVSLLSIVLVGLFILASYLVTPKTSGDDIVVIRYNNRVVHVMPLNVDDEFIMKKSEGYLDLYGDELVVTVKNSKVSITKEESPFHICSYYGEISKRGSSLICIPNCVQVTIESKEGNNDISSSDIDIIG